MSVRALSLGVLALACACRREDDPPPALAGPPAQPWIAPSAAPPPATPSPPPAAGFPCQSDADLPCALGRCQRGACGGCAGDADCKPGARCVPTPVGLACLPAAWAQGAPPTAPPPPPTPTAPPPAPAPPGRDRFEGGRRRCVELTNAYRARVGVAPLSRRSEREPCVDAEAAANAASGRAHGAFGRCGELAQNECPDYPGQSPEATIDACLAAMFAEGPGEPYSEHGHYLNMTNRGYTGVACGFAVTASGRLWVTQGLFP